MDKILINGKLMNYSLFKKNKYSTNVIRMFNVYKAPQGHWKLSEVIE